MKTELKIELREEVYHWLDEQATDDDLEIEQVIECYLEAVYKAFEISKSKNKKENSKWKK